MNDAALGQMRFATALGVVTVAWTTAGVVRVSMSPDDAAGGVAAGGGGPVPEVRPDPVPQWIADLVSRLARHLEGVIQDFSDIPVDTSGWPPFFAQARQAARGIGPGKIVTYGELAVRAGRPRAARAVGQAMATNPVLLIVPCHRVVSSGGLGGFSGGGVAVKRRLLALEGVPSIPAPGRRGTLAGHP